MDGNRSGIHFFHRNYRFDGNEHIFVCTMDGFILHAVSCGLSHVACETWWYNFNTINTLVPMYPSKSTLFVFHCIVLTTDACASLLNTNDNQINTKCALRSHLAVVTIARSDCLRNHQKCKQSSRWYDYKWKNRWPRIAYASGKKKTFRSNAKLDLFKSENWKKIRLPSDSVCIKRCQSGQQNEWKIAINIR